MLRGRQFPAWLVRRGYFRRIGRWVKPRRRAQAVSEPAPAPISNVLPFPEIARGPRRMPEVALRGLESA